MIGRFTQEDTYRGDGLNLYAYCGNNPVRYHDPSGHEQKYSDDFTTESGQSRVEQVDGEVGNGVNTVGNGSRWWEAKSGNYWSMLEENPNKMAKFKSDMGDRLRIATENGVTYELFSNMPIPESVKQWLTKKGYILQNY